MMTGQSVVHSGAGRPFLSYLNPLAMLRNLYAHRELTWQLAKRDVQIRYREAQLGLLWAVLSPLILLCIYTFVFSIVFAARWGDDPNESRGQFALTLFCGMLLFNLFGEVAQRSPYMVVSNPNYVKKVVFPLEVFPVSGLLSAMINMLIGYAVWLIGWGMIQRTLPPWTIIWFPLVLAPVCLTTLGVSWFLASLGVFLRDVSHAVVLGVQVLFFASPVFYSMERVKQPFRLVLEVNPLSHAIEDVRRILMHGQPPDWGWWIGSTAASVVLAVLGYTFFMKSKRAFADVL